jgi:hypothetical protein
MRNLRKEAESFVKITSSDVGNPSKEIERKAVDSYEICLGCEVLSNSKQKCDAKKEGKAVKSFIYNNKEVNRGDIVTGCNCPLVTKIRSNSLCPLGKW